MLFTLMSVLSLLFPNFHSFSDSHSLHINYLFMMKPLIHVHGGLSLVHMEALRIAPSPDGPDNAVLMPV